MAAHKVKCFYCSQQFDANIEPYLMVNSRRYAHKKCFEEAEKIKIKEEKDKEVLENYIKKLFDIDKITVKIARQIKDYRTNRQYNYIEIYESLKYIFEVRKNPIEKANQGIGIVPYIFDEAKKYWKDLREAQERNKNIKVNDFVLPAKEIKIRSPTREPMKHTRKLFNFLNEVEDSE